jgi:crotonobetainyl-CoA:carnitine CoA-transferase CaiB-like acyl-CoA transferase
LELPGGAMTKTFGPPLRLNGEGGIVERRAPALGEHTDEIRRRYGSGQGGG